MGELGWTRRIIGWFALAIIAVYLLLFCGQIWQRNVFIDAGQALIIVPLMLLAVAAQPRPSRMIAMRTDGALWLFLAADLAVVIPLWWLSTGAWYNYSIPTAILFAILTARAMERAIDQFAPGLWVRLPLTLAGLAGIAAVTADLESTYRKRALLEEATRVTLEQLHRKPSEIYFVDRPGANRLYGRIDLVHDTWLYPIFEATHLAEARSIWLERALASGQIRVVINSSDSGKIDGITRTLFKLGFSPDINVGPVYVWLR